MVAHLRPRPGSKGSRLSLSSHRLVLLLHSESTLCTRSLMWSPMCLWLHPCALVLQAGKPALLKRGLLLSNAHFLQPKASGRALHHPRRACGAMQ